MSLRSTASIFLILIGLTAPSQAADAMKRIVIVESVRAPLLVRATDEFINSLAALGLVDGETATIERYHSEGDAQKATKFLETVLAQEKPDLVVTVSTMTAVVAAKVLAGTEVPHIFLFMSDPVVAGFVSAIGEKSDQLLTGVSQEISSRARLEFMQKILSTRKGQPPLRIGVLHSPYIASVRDAEALLQASDHFDAFSLVPLLVPFRASEFGLEKARQDVVEALEKRSDEFDAIWITVGPIGGDAALIKRIFDAGHKIVFATNLRTVKAGALYGVLPNVKANSATAADMAAEILSGVKANDLPVVRPTELIMGVNLTTADSLEVVIPFPVLRLAGQNVYR